MKLSLAVAALLVPVMGVLAGEELFPVAFQKIGKMKPAEAAQAYIELAGKTRKPVQVNAAYFAAVQKLILAKKYDEAQKLLESIRDEQVKAAANIEILFARRQWAALADYANPLPIESWQDSLRPEAAYKRAYANALGKKLDQAEKDIQMAVKFTANLAEKYIMIQKCAVLYESWIKKPEAEMKLLEQALAIPEEFTIPFYVNFVHCRYAMLLAQSGKFDEALKFLSDYKVDKAASRRARVQATFAQIHLLKGDKKQAVECYRTAIQLYPPWKAGYEKQIKAIEK